ncbi:MAG: class I SAM-dependent methyltransferase [Chloroflexi bacterium]|nr:class I SAM-dependent methyltransferase [Chloroflexota bacterium]
MRTQAFENAYGGTPSWEIGRPQGAVLRLEEAGRIGGSVLDAGCGTGDASVYLARRGHHVVGFDFAPSAIAIAARKAADAGLAGRARFFVADALRLGDGLQAADVAPIAFDTVLDIGLFHTLQPTDRRAYVAALRSLIAPDGRLFLLAWSDRNPFGYGPERVRRRDIRAAVAGRWRVESIVDEALETRLGAGHAHAWLAELSPLPVADTSRVAGPGAKLTPPRSRRHPRASQE